MTIFHETLNGQFSPCFMVAPMWHQFWSAGQKYAGLGFSQCMRIQDFKITFQLISLLLFVSVLTMLVKFYDRDCGQRIELESDKFHETHINPLKIPPRTNSKLSCLMSILYPSDFSVLWFLRPLCYVVSF